MKLPFGHVYRDLICNNFDNILQSIVGFGTFTAYTNDTRFNWAYPSNTATEDDEDLFLDDLTEWNADEMKGIFFEDLNETVDDE